MANAFIFTGPTLSINDIPLANYTRGEEKIILNNGNSISFLPPVSEGDIFSIVDKTPDIIGIIDGYFENVPAVWHKEILYAMKKGIHVLGSSSMGALRAAELSAFGMEGIGEIYNSFASGEYGDDDEVTIAHGPAELGYPLTSEAMANIRRTVQAAFKAGVITHHDTEKLIKSGKSIFYKRRTYPQIIEGAKKIGLSEEASAHFSRWVSENHIDQKKKDGLALIEEVLERLKNPIKKKEVLYSFEETIIWRNARCSNGNIG